MSGNDTISDYCVIDHLSEAGRAVPIELGPIWMRPIWLVRMGLNLLDRRLHFTGFRGGTWRLFGVGRSSKNPNICNI